MLTPVIGTWHTASAFGALTAALSGATAVISVHISRKVNAETTRREQRQMAMEFQARAYALFPRLVDEIGIDDGIPPEDRKLVIPLFGLYAAVWLAHDEGVITDRDWQAHEGHLSWWLSQPKCRSVWEASTRLYGDTYTPGFVEYVNSVLARKDAAAA